MITICRHSFQNQQCSGLKVLVTFRQVVGNSAISDEVSIFDVDNTTEYPTRCLRFLIVTSESVPKISNFTTKMNLKTLCEQKNWVLQLFRKNRVRT